MANQPRHNYTDEYARERWPRIAEYDLGDGWYPDAWGVCVHGRKFHDNSERCEGYGWEDGDWRGETLRAAAVNLCHDRFESGVVYDTGHCFSCGSGSHPLRSLTTRRGACDDPRLARVRYR